MKRFCRYLMVSSCVVYVVVTLIAVYKLYCVVGDKESDGISQLHYPGTNTHISKTEYLKISLNSETTVKRSNVEIWGKAAIAKYLWHHILDGKVENGEGGLVETGFKILHGINFTYRYGPGVIQTTVPSDVEKLVLVLNGRSEEKINVAKQWLDYVPLYKKLTHIAVVLLGDEGCSNDWLLPYMKSRGGRIDVAFLVYDSPLIDNVQFYQWPLGVAVYRGFPDVKPKDLDLKSSRSLTCNFLGTIYENSSRQLLSDVIKKSGLQDSCYIKGRKKWQPNETPETLKIYMSALLKSDLTLSPVGKNTECYRIYEAMSLGSVPVVEDVVTPGNCDTSADSPLRLLKQYGAPIIYVKSWHQLHIVLHQESQLTVEEKAARRIQVTEWYKNFKTHMSASFVQVIEKKFL
ncbi:ribitol-5-phosphate xylosyltransferase 1-like [Schistocerca gregaria]|uniref:Ribitol-5-phosphate xylosyltransferase 1 n=1 Tax=Schistocerca gregaria TaxID=7010 RepID=A0A8E5JTD7_SCHGR|nr:ribitol-5-phosphate xylosyltransferase 1-like [Schistocerca gregaria]QVD39526.1 Ribitol-5-phosphate xylosyltransferase 1 [Schistocerca gregaria]